MIQSHLAVNINLPIAGNRDDAALLKSTHQRLILLQLLLSLRGLRIGLAELSLILLFALLVLLVTLLILCHQTLQLLNLLLLLDLDLADNIARINVRRSALTSRGRRTLAWHIRGLNAIRVGKSHSADRKDSNAMHNVMNMAAIKAVICFFMVTLLRVILRPKYN